MGKEDRLPQARRHSLNSQPPSAFACKECRLEWLGFRKHGARPRACAPYLCSWLSLIWPGLYQARVHAQLARPKCILLRSSQGYVFASRKEPLRCDCGHLDQDS